MALPCKPHRMAFLAMPARQGAWNGALQIASPQIAGWCGFPGSVASGPAQRRHIGPAF
jgi:hypothetical protein